MTTTLACARIFDLLIYNNNQQIYAHSGVSLIVQGKETLAEDLKIAFENETVAIPRSRELTSQIHSVKKMPTEAGYARFDTEKNERHHADKFWALALAVHAAGLGKERKRQRKKVEASVV